MSSTNEGKIDDEKGSIEPVDVENSVPPYEKEDNAEDTDTSSSDEIKKEQELLERFPLRSTTITLPNGNEIKFNGLTTLIGFAALWGLAIWCMVDPKGSFKILTDWQASVTDIFTWFYIASNPAFTFFVVS